MKNTAGKSASGDAKVLKWRNAYQEITDIFSPSSPGKHLLHQDCCSRILERGSQPMLGLNIQFLTQIILLELARIFTPLFSGTGEESWRSLCLITRAHPEAGCRMRRRWDLLQIWSTQHEHTDGHNTTSHEHNNEHNNEHNTTLSTPIHTLSKVENMTNMFCFAKY